MVFPAPWTAVHSSPNRSTRQAVGRRGVVLHHGALTSLDYLRSLCMGAKQVSATAICKDGQIELMVPNDNDRPWSLSSAYWDSALRSVETANDSTTGWTISDASHWSLARAVAHWASTDGFWPHRDGDPGSWTVIGHREVYSIHGASYATACPGGLDLDLVTRRAQALLGSATAGDGVTPIVEEETDMIVVQRVDAGNAVYSLGQEFARNLGTGGTASAFAQNYTGKAVREVNEIEWKNLLFGLGIPLDVVPGTNGVWSRARDAVVSAQAATAAAAALKPAE